MSRSRKRRVAHHALLIAILVGLAGSAHSTIEPPYPPSVIVESVEWDLGSIQEYGDGSDLWPMTWGDDGNVYATWGDGWGFNNDLGAKQFIGVTRVSGEPPALVGQDLWGIPTNSYPEAKPQAIVAYEEAIYLFYDRFYEDRTFSWPAWSYDHGESFVRGPEPVFRVDDDGAEMIVKGICQYGPGYSGAPTSFIYVYFAELYGDKIFLGRVQGHSIFDRNSYTFFAGIGESGIALWSPATADKVPVFEDPNRFIWHISVSYDAGIGRYLLTKPHFDEGDVAWQDVASIGMFDSPDPWGPWTTIIYENDFIDDQTKFNYIVPTKYISQDGLGFWLAWSGWPYYDSVSFIRGTLHLSLAASNEGPGRGRGSGARAGLTLWPNPCRDGMQIMVEEVDDRKRAIGIFDEGGRLIRRLASSGIGTRIVWDGRNGRNERAGAGVYFVRLLGSGTQSEARRVVLLR